VYVKPVDSLVLVDELAYQSTTSSTSAVADKVTGPVPHRLPFVTMGSARRGFEVSTPETAAEEQFVVLFVMTTV
jgi:hypothetical protein